jgi:hypothetical protein
LQQSLPGRREGDGLGVEIMMINIQWIELPLAFVGAFFLIGMIVVAFDK